MADSRCCRLVRAYGDSCRRQRISRCFSLHAWALTAPRPTIILSTLSVLALSISRQPNPSIEEGILENVRMSSYGSSGTTPPAPLGSGLPAIQANCATLSRERVVHFPRNYSHFMQRYPLYSWFKPHLGVSSLCKRVDGKHSKSKGQESRSDNVIASRK